MEKYYRLLVRCKKFDETSKETKINELDVYVGYEDKFIVLFGELYICRNGERPYYQISQNINEDNQGKYISLEIPENEGERKNLRINLNDKIEYQVYSKTNPDQIVYQFLFWLIEEPLEFRIPRFVYYKHTPDPTRLNGFKVEKSYKMPYGEYESRDVPKEITSKDEFDLYFAQL